MELLQATVSANSEPRSSCFSVWSPCWPPGSPPMIFATRTTFLIGLVSGLISIVIGANIGLFSAFYGGKIDEILMRFTDIVYGMPFLPFLIVLISLFGR